MFLISGLLLLMAMAVAVFFRKKIKQICVQQLDEVVNTEVSISNLEFSVFKNFPHISIKLNNLKIKDAIEGSSDSVLVLKSAYLGLDVLELVKGHYVVNYCELKGGYLRIRIDNEGRHNYKLFKTNADQSTDRSFKLSIRELVLDSVRIGYLDQRVENNHSLFAKQATCMIDHNGDFSKLKLNGDFDVDYIGISKSRYLKRKPCSIDAELDFNHQSFLVTLKETRLKIEQAIFNLEGTILAQAVKHWDLTISSPSSDVQALVALLPHGISRNLNQYRSSGGIYFNGKIQGEQSSTTSPRIDVDFGFENASFYHPEIDQKITKASLKGSFTNGEKHTSATSRLILSDFQGYLSNDLIKGNMSYTNFDNPYLDIDLMGKFGIASALQVYPIQKIKKASGEFEADVNFKGFLKDLQDESRAKNIKTSGRFTLINGSFELEGSQLAYQDFNGQFYFDKHDLGITKFTGRVGASDFDLDGYFKNFISYVLLDEQVLQIKAVFKSDYIDLDEILSKGMISEAELTESTKKSSSYSFKLSPYLAYDLNCQIGALKIRRLKEEYLGKNLKGRLNLKTQILNYQDLKMDLAGGQVRLNGVINAMDSNRVHVRNNTKIQNIEVSKAFYVLENFGQSFITDDNLKGILTANAETILNFDSKLRLDLGSIKTMAEVQINEGSLVNFEPMKELGKFLTQKKFKRYLKSTDFSNINFNQLSNTIFIDDQNINIPEMIIQSDLSSDMTIKGTHTFDNAIDYSIYFPLVNYHRENRLDQKGIDLDEEKKWTIYLDIKGTVDDYTIDFDQAKSLKSAAKAAGDRIMQVFEEDETYIELDTTQVMEDVLIDTF